jgi:hypothetical protein
MAEVLHVFDEWVALDGVPYRAQICGRAAGHIWEGWIEFIATDGSDARRTARETTQPNREALHYWATGLSPVYLEGALARTLEPPPVRIHEPAAVPLFDAPAPNPVNDGFETDRAILDPFSVGAKGERLLRQELNALAGWHLRNIVRAYRLADPAVDLEVLTEPELVELIVGAVQPA